MSQAFETTYKRYHRWHEIDRRTPFPPYDRFANTLPSGDNWLVIKTLEEQQESGGKLSEVEDVVRNMYRNRLWSTYQLHFCKDMIPREGFEKEASDNELLKSCKRLYNHKDFKILPPRPSARRDFVFDYFERGRYFQETPLTYLLVFGYLRPTYTYTPLTMYQLVHGKMGYDILKKGYEGTEVQQKKSSPVITKEPESKIEKDVKKDPIPSSGYPLDKKESVHELIRYQSKGNKICVCRPCKINK